MEVVNFPQFFESIKKGNYEYTSNLEAELRGKLHQPKNLVDGTVNFANYWLYGKI